MEGKEELLKLAYKQLDQAAKLLKAAGEEPLAEEAEALALRVDSSAGAPLFNRKGPALGPHSILDTAPRHAAPHAQLDSTGPRHAPYSWGCERRFPRRWSTSGTLPGGPSSAGPERKSLLDDGFARRGGTELRVGRRWDHVAQT